jgi:hypothetical protein
MSRPALEHLTKVIALGRDVGPKDRASWEATYHAATQAASNECDAITDPRERENHAAGIYLAVVKARGFERRPDPKFRALPERLQVAAAKAFYEDLCREAIRGEQNQ